MADAMVQWSSRRSSRQARAVESFRSAAEAIGPIDLGMSVFLITRGAYSMLDMVTHVVREIGPSSVSVWTWAIACHEIEAMAGLMASSAITAGRLIVDRSAEQRSVGTIDAWRDRFGAEAVRVCKNHAKIARVWTADRHVLLRGSMNLNWNPRFEQADVTEGGPEFDLVAEIEERLPVLPRLCTNAEAEAASGLGRSFEQGQLAMFAGVKLWAK